MNQIETENETATAEGDAAVRASRYGLAPPRRAVPPS